MVDYQTTDVGLIPADWNVVKINDVAQTGSGTTPARALHSRYFEHGEHHWVKTTDLNNSKIQFTQEMVSELALKETSLSVYPIDAVLVAMYGGFNQIGRTGILAVQAAVNQALVAIITDPDKLCSLYLLYVLNYRVRDWRKVASSSRKDPNITSSDVKAFKLAKPINVEEQKSIAKALSDTDALITALEKLIEKKRAIKTATMQQLLTGKTRLPGFGEGKGYKDSELGRIPEDWDVCALGDILVSTQLGGNY